MNGRNVEVSDLVWLLHRIRCFKQIWMIGQRKLITCVVVRRRKIRMKCMPRLLWSRKEQWVTNSVDFFKLLQFSRIQWVLSSKMVSEFIKLQQLDDPTSPDPSPPESQRPKVHSFSKVLTASDTSTHGGFSVLRKHATECLPPLVWGHPVLSFLPKWLHIWLGVSAFDLNFICLHPLGYDPANPDSRVSSRRCARLSVEIQAYL